MQFQSHKHKIIIVDFGSQVTKLIARRVREFGIYSEILIPSQIKNVKNYNSVKGIILSGGPSTVTKKKISDYTKKDFGIKNTNIRNLLWSTTYCKTIWR